MFKLLLCCALFLGAYAFNHGQDMNDFDTYMGDFTKHYDTTADRNNANYYFNYNSKLIAQQNALADRKLSSYRVKANIFSDMRLITFASLLPKAVYPTTANALQPPPTAETILPAYDILIDNGITVNPLDQGTKCSSSWAQAAVKAIQIMDAIQPVKPTPVEYTAQNIIDCAGPNSCTTQTPQTAFDYLTNLKDTYVVPDTEYPEIYPGMCKPVTPSPTSIQLLSYSTIPEGNDTILMNIVSNVAPVIVEYNPATFGFMHYSSGVYVPPTKAKASSSQFLLVVGYGHDPDSKLDYWRCLNSFGKRWGEDGFIRIVRNTNQPIAKKAIYPSNLGAPPTAPMLP